MNVDRLNGAAEPELLAELAQCLGSEAWARALVDARPFADGAAVLTHAAGAWQDLDADAWRAALRATPDPQVPDGSDDARAAAEVALQLYRQRFGYAFVSDTGSPTAEELLMLIRIRLGHEEAAELRRSRDEYGRLARQRLERLLRAGAPS